MQHGSRKIHQDAIKSTHPKNYCQTRSIPEAKKFRFCAWKLSTRDKINQIISLPAPESCRMKLADKNQEFDCTSCAVGYYTNQEVGGLPDTIAAVLTNTGCMAEVVQAKMQDLVMDLQVRHLAEHCLLVAAEKYLTLK